jgi:hypothetical protein
MPNFSTGSGGSVFAYNPNGGTSVAYDSTGRETNVGHYVDSKGNEHTYTY